MLISVATFLALSVALEPTSFLQVERQIRALKDPDRHVRGHAAFSLTNPDLDPAARTAALPHLRRCLQDHSGGVREAAVYALLRLQDSDAVTELRRIIREDPDEHVRLFTLSNIGKLGPSAAPAAPELLHALRESNDPIFQKWSATSLRIIGPTGFEILRKTWEDPAAPPEVREAAILPFRDLPGDHPPLIPLVGSFVRAVDDEAIADTAAEILRKLDQSVVRQAIPTLERLVVRKPSLSTLEASNLLARFDPGNSYIMAGFLYGLKAKDSGVRVRALEYMKELRPFPRAAGIPAVLRAFNDHDSEVQAGACDLLLAIGPDARSLVPVMRSILESGPADSRYSTALDILYAIDRNR
jgi:HEAT repeat protein